MISLVVFMNFLYRLLNEILILLFLVIYIRFGWYGSFKIKKNIYIINI